MFKPKDKKDRLNYGSLLKPPKNFNFVRAVATSFSLDFDTLTAAAFALALGGDTDTELVDNLAMCLRSLKNISDKLVVFTEAGQIKKPRKDNPLYALLSKTVSTITLQKTSAAASYPSFHPKVWVAEYASRTEKRYRLLVLSRNLTFDRSYDCCVCFDGKVGGAVGEKQKTQPLIDFLAFLEGTVDKTAPNATAKRGIVTDFINTLKDVTFEISESGGAFNGFDLFPLGIPKVKKLLATNFDTNRYHDLVIMSPFLSEDIITRFSNTNSNIGAESQKRYLFTRQTELHRLQMVKSSDLTKWAVYVLKDSVVRDEENAGEDEDCREQDIHAKIYARNYWNGGALYLGSANASHNAFFRNVEFMVGLYSHHKYNKGFLPRFFLCDLLGEDENDKECPFQRVSVDEILAAKKDDATQDETRNLERIIKDFCRVTASGNVTSTDGKFAINITIEKTNQPDFRKLKIAPLGEDGKASTIQEDIRFEDVDLLHLTEFYTITATSDASNVAPLSRVILIPTKGIPSEDVENAIINKAFEKKEAFYEYLIAILSDDILSGYLTRDLDGLTAADKLSAKAVGTALYERLLYAAAHHPERLREIIHIEERLAGDWDGRAEFKQVLSVFETAVKNTDKKSGGGL